MNYPKILFIIQSYPAEMSANALCDERIIEALKQTGKYEIHCLAYRYNFQPAEENIKGVQVHRFSKGPWWNIYTWARRKNSLFAKLIIYINRLLMRIEQAITIPIYPHTTFWISWLGYRYACKLHRKYKFDVVITEHNALDTTLSGYLLKKKFPKIKFMPIFWDPLSGGIMPKYLPFEYSSKKSIKIEKKIFNIANKVIVMNSHFPRLEKNYNSTNILDNVKVLDLPSLQSPQITEKKVLNYSFDSDTIYVCFAGNLSNRNLTLIANLLEKTGLRNLKLLVISLPNMQDMVEALNKKISLSIDFLPYMPHDQLMVLFGKVHIFVNLGVDSDTMVASKIFEYIGFGKPVIDTYLRNDDANLLYLKKYPLSFLIDERDIDLEKQANNLRNFIEQNAYKHIPYEQIAPVFYTNTPCAYVKEIEELIKE